MISGRSSDTTYEPTENWKPGNIFGDGGAAEHVPALEDEHLPARAGEIGRGQSPLWPPPMTIASYFWVMACSRSGHPAVERRSAIRNAVCWWFAGGTPANDDGEDHRRKGLPPSSGGL